MPTGSYMVRVIVNGIFVPLYQYAPNVAMVWTRSQVTPTINEIQPDTALPGSFVTITGNFMVS